MRFRKFIESAANSYHVRGYVFNDPDGSVKMLCGGSVESVNELFHAIQTRAPPGISIGQFVKDEIITDIDLNMPLEFLKLGTDEILDIGRKLDKGVKLLKALPDIKESVSMLPGIMENVSTLPGIKESVSILPDIKESVSMLPGIKESVSMLPSIKTGIDAMNMKFDAFTDEQRTFNQKVGSHTKRLDGYIEEQRGYTKRLDSYIEEQRGHNKLMGAHNLRLEQILQKLVEK
ncbi:MAG: acylphosphatase [Candidatus Methanogasteraceae archaeon]